MTNLDPPQMHQVQYTDRIPSREIEDQTATEWRSTHEAVGKPSTYINVRTTTTYRWLAYKPDGARQMGVAGRWQRATEYGWENAKLPPGEFIPNERIESND